MVSVGSKYAHNKTGIKYVVLTVSILKHNGVWWDHDPLITYTNGKNNYSRFQSDFLIKFTLKD